MAKLLRTWQAAIEEGVVVGGGCSLLRLSQKVDGIKKLLDNEEQQVIICSILLSFPLSCLKFIIITKLLLVILQSIASIHFVLCLFIDCSRYENFICNIICRLELKSSGEH